MISWVKVFFVKYELEFQVRSLQGGIEVMLIYLISVSIQKKM